MATSALTKAAMARKQERGEYVGGRVPYGWNLAADGVHLVANHQEQVAISHARSLRRAGLSLRAIADRLADKGITPKQGGAWHAQTVKTMLAAPLVSCDDGQTGLFR